MLAASRDTIFGGPGNAIMLGRAGANDDLVGDAGSDTLGGGVGSVESSGCETTIGIPSSEERAAPFLAPCSSPRRSPR